jgi:hypothetical protein
MSMLVFVDESGDSGMKGKRGTSPLFVIAAVIFEEDEEAEACDSIIEETKRKLFKNPATEFHFSKCSDDYRQRFFEAVASSQFFYLAFVLNKEKIWGPGFQDKSSFYKYTASLLFENAKPHLKAASVTIDRCGNREFRQQLDRYLKRKINTHREIIRKVKCESSNSNNLLQLADMICGAVARSFREDKEHPNRFRKIIGLRELNVQVWPRV